MYILKKILFFVLILESRLILAKYKPFIIAVTGSVGKTSTKDAIFDVLKDQSRYVRKSDKSFNSEIGLPLTVIGVPNAWHDISGWMNNVMAGVRLIFRTNEYPDCLVLEIGADHPGDIKKVAAWLHPDISVITQISATPVHVEFFASPEEVFEEKAALATAVKEGGTLILFADNEKVAGLAQRVQGRNVNVISFGTVETAKVRGVEEKVVYEIVDSNSEPVIANPNPKSPSGLTFKLVIDAETAQVSIPGIIGSSYMYPLLAAASVGIARGVPMTSIAEGLNRYNAPKGRMHLIPGMNGSTLIDDTYNSSPDAASSALKTLRNIECSGTKIAVLGDMMELGQYASDEHRKIGKEAASVAGLLVTVGQRSRATADEALKGELIADKVRSFDSSVEAAEYLKTVITPGDVVLIKGSQSIRMEKAVALLMKDPTQAEKLLVRQEVEWLAKK